MSAAAVHVFELDRAPIRSLDSAHATNNNGQGQTRLQCRGLLGRLSARWPGDPVLPYKPEKEDSSNGTLQWTPRERSAVPPI
jgi:hypothetical protein